MSDTLTAAEARGLALRAQGFGDARLRDGIDVLERLGAIQMDSVNVLARNHLLVPVARIGPYSVEDLHNAIYAEKRGFEYWGHMASWLPMAEYRYFLPRMQRNQRIARGWWANVRSEHADLYAPILDRVRGEGPIGAAAFDDPRGGGGTWWDWKPAKLVLEDLFDQGVLMCARRTRGFARLYDLAERVLPSTVDARDPGVEAASRHLLLRGLEGLGVATAAELIDYFRLKPADSPRPAISALVADGEIVPVTVEGWPTVAYALPAMLNGDLGVPEHVPTFLAPFDNLMWKRDRIERIFGFHYRVEIYVPEPKRTFGYFVLPLLARGQLVGRADLKLDRAEGVLRVRGLWLSEADPAEAQQALEMLARQLGAQSVSRSCAEKAG